MMGVPEQALQYFAFIRGVAHKAKLKLGSGPFQDYVKGTVTRSPNDALNIAAFVREQVEFSSWVVSPKLHSIVLNHTSCKDKVLFGDQSDVIRAMLFDVRLESEKLLENSTPAYYRMRFQGGRFIVADDYYTHPSSDTEGNIVQWTDFENYEKLTKHKTIAFSEISWHVDEHEYTGECQHQGINKEFVERAKESIKAQYLAARLPVPVIEIVGYDKDGKEIS